MKPADLFAALLYPLTETRVLVPLLFFWLLMALASVLGFAGVMIIFVVTLAVFRYQMIVLESRARNTTPDTPDVEFFTFIGNAWSLFPLPLIIAIIWLLLWVEATFGPFGAFLVLLGVVAVLPASLVILAITHSPLHSLNPVAILRLLTKCRGTFWLASVYLAVVMWASYRAESLPFALANGIQLTLTFSFFSLTGTLVQPYGLVEDVYLPDALASDEAEVAGGVEKSRERALGHAYGFISRGNSDGGFTHLFAEIERDPDAVSAWSWYFEHMLRWENTRPALLFAQHYVHDMLVHGEAIPALKLIMRCRLVDERWKPAEDDRAAAVDAAETSGNTDLADVLRRG